MFGSPELAQIKSLGSLNVRRPSSVHIKFVNNVMVTFSPQLTSNLVRIKLGQDALASSRLKNWPHETKTEKNLVKSLVSEI
jgi:hypothetical protein